MRCSARARQALDLLERWVARAKPRRTRMADDTDFDSICDHPRFQRDC